MGTAKAGAKGVWEWGTQTRGRVMAGPGTGPGTGAVAWDLAVKGQGRGWMSGDGCGWGATKEAAVSTGARQ